MKRVFATFSPGLPRAVWLYEAAGLPTAVGLGMVLPFLVLYLHNVRGFSLGMTGSIMATWTAAAVVGAFAGGALSDLFGARRTAQLAAWLVGAGCALYPLIHRPWQGFLICSFAGLARGAAFPSGASLLATIAPEQHRHTAYSLSFAKTNLGFAAGAALAGLVAHSSRPGTYAAVFLIAGATYWLFAALLPFVAPRDSATAPRVAAAPRARHREVLGQRVILGLAGIVLLYSIGGIAVWEVGLPVLAKNRLALGERDIGLLFLVNSLVIVVAQFPLTKALEGRRRMRALALTTVLWSVAWLLVLAAGVFLERGAGAFVVLGGAAVLFALGECLVPPAQGALVADLAPVELRGRCMAIISNAFGLGVAGGGAAAGFVLGWQPLALWPLAAGLLVAAGLCLLALERGVPTAFRRIPRRPRAAVEPAAATP